MANKRFLSLTDWRLITNALASANPSKRGNIVEMNIWYTTVGAMFDSLSSAYDINREKFYEDCGTVYIPDTVTVEKVAKFS